MADSTAHGPIAAFTLAEAVGESRRRHALETGHLDPMDLEDIDRALDSLENPGLLDSMGSDDALSLIRSILADYRPE